MQYGNWMLTAELERLRRDDIHRELAHERFLASHGLDLWSVLRRAVDARLRLRRRSAGAPLAQLPPFAHEGQGVGIR